MSGGHPKQLDPIVAQRLRNICAEVIEQRFEGISSDLARAVGRTPAAIQQFMSGTTDLSLETITRLAALLQIEPFELLRTPDDPESREIPTPRTQTLSAVLGMAKMAGIAEAFLQRWRPVDPDERDPDVLWAECKRRYEEWKERKSDAEPPDRRHLTRRYFLLVEKFATRIAEKLKDTSENGLLNAVKQIYLDPALPAEFVTHTSASASDARIRHPLGSPVVLAEYCFRHDILFSLREQLAERSSEKR